MFYSLIKSRRFREIYGTHIAAALTSACHARGCSFESRRSRGCRSTAAEGDCFTAATLFLCG